MTVYRYRDAVTGEYVTEEYAKKHPRRTVRETETEARLADDVDLPDTAEHDTLGDLTDKAPYHSEDVYPNSGEN